MIARDNLTRERLTVPLAPSSNSAGQLDGLEAIIGGRGYTAGDRVIARRNDRRRDIDNGTLATIVAVDPDTGSKELGLEARLVIPSPPGKALAADFLRSANGGSDLSRFGVEPARLRRRRAIGRGSMRSPRTGHLRQEPDRVPPTFGRPLVDPV